MSINNRHEPVQLSRWEFEYVTRTRQCLPDAWTETSTAASADQMQANLQATNWLADDNSQDPNAASSSEPQRWQVRGPDEWSISGTRPPINLSPPEWEYVGAVGSGLLGCRGCWVGAVGPAPEVAR